MSSESIPMPIENSPSRNRSRQNQQLVSSLMARISPKNSRRKYLQAQPYDRIDDEEEVRNEEFLRCGEQTSPIRTMAESTFYENDLQNFCIVDSSDDESDNGGTFGEHDGAPSLNSTDYHKQAEELPVLPPLIPVEEIPSTFICPLTLQIMEDPVQDNCGHTFERNAIIKLLEQSYEGVCPISQKPLVPICYRCVGNDSKTLPCDDYDRIFKRNESLQKRILEWKLDHPLYQGLDANYGQNQRRNMMRHDIITDESMHSSNSNNSNQSSRDCPYGYEISSSGGNDTNDYHSNRDSSHHTLSKFELMFLPQEREALRMLKRRTKDERERKYRSQRCTMGIALIVAVLLLTARYLVVR